MYLSPIGGGLLFTNSTLWPNSRLSCVAIMPYYRRNSYVCYIYRPKQILELKASLNAVIQGLSGVKALLVSE